MMKKTPRTNVQPSLTSKPEIGQMLTLATTSFNEEGYALSSVDARPVWVTGALPGELVRARVTHNGRRESYATVVKILRRAPGRLTSPPCSIAECDGCPLIAMNYPGQLAWKRELVAHALGTHPPLRDAVLHDVIPSPQPLQYRNAAKLVVAGKFAA